MSNLRSSPNTIIYSLLGINTHSSMIFTHLECNNSQWLQHPKTFPRENPKYYSFVCVSWLKKETIALLCSHIRRKFFFSSQFFAIIQTSQILLHYVLSINLREYRNHVISFYIYATSQAKIFFFSSLLVSSSHLATSKVKIYRFFSLGFTLNSMIFLQSS